MRQSDSECYSMLNVMNVSSLAFSSCANVVNAANCGVVTGATCECHECIVNCIFGECQHLLVKVL